MPNKLNQRIAEHKKRSAPINYSTVSINQMGQLEQRSTLLNDRIVEGYGCIWGVRNEHGEMFTRGCFAKTISEYGPGSNSSYQIKFRDEHGRACALFETLIEDEIGLYFRTKPLDAVQWCDDLLVQLRSGTINNFSNGFKYIWDRVQWDDNNDCLVILEARLFEISAVAIPSDMATFTMRSAEEIEYLQDDTEDFIQSLPKSKQLEARKIFARYIPPVELSPLEVRKAPKVDTPDNGIDYSALRAELKKHSLIN
jgi:uncharacterized protein